MDISLSRVYCVIVRYLIKAMGVTSMKRVVIDPIVFMACFSRAAMTMAVLVASAMLLAPTQPARAAEDLPDGLGIDAVAGACDRTTAAAAQACAKGAVADYDVAQGACANFNDAGARDRCLRQAATDFRDATDLCGEQRQARAGVCRALGQAPYDPTIRPAEFTTNITNPYFPLRPGRTFVYRAPHSVVTVRVTNQTIKIQGVTCRVVRDTNLVDGKVAEDTFDYYAQDRQGNVWYFGESTAEFEHGIPVSVEGSFKAGIDNAKAGIIMLANPRPGTTYRQEFSLTVAEDLARVEALGVRVKVPYGSFDNALRTFEFTPLEPDAKERKFYVPGVGQVLTIDLETGEREELVRVSG